MLDMLKHEGSAWAIIAACKGAKEEIKAFEKKVKGQFSMVPFEDITPVPNELDLEKVEKEMKELEETVPLETPVKSDHKVIAEATFLDKTLPFTPKETNKAESNGNIKRKEEQKAGPPSKVSKMLDVEEVKKLETKECSEEETEVLSKKEVSKVLCTM